MYFEEKDENIINSYKDGNEEAFKMLIDKYTSPLFNFVAHLAGKNDSPDIVQETFIKAWKNLHKFDSSKASFKTWIFTIAKNSAMDFLRKKKVFLFSDIEKTENESSKEKSTWFSENIPDDNMLPDEILEKMQDFDLLKEKLEKLPLNYKTVLLLHYQEEMTFEEIGRVLEKPLNTVKNQHYRAIIMLRKMFSDYL